MAQKKKYRLDLIETLRSLNPGQSVKFIIAGSGIETTYGSLVTAKCNYKLPITIVKTNNGLEAIVTRKDDDTDDN